MRGFSLPLTRLVHENLSIVMCFAYSQKPLVEMTERRFLGEWKYLNKALFDLSALRAEKACFELALFLRMVDDEEKISHYHTATQNVPNCGKIVMKDKSERPLPFREVSNKIIHSSRLEWEFFNSPEPMLICHTREDEKWMRAEVDIIAVAGVCGQLMS
jgi:hypothetical protein